MKRWNKLNTKTVHKTGMVKTDIMRHHIAAGLVPTQKKHKFRELDMTETSTADADATEGDKKALACFEFYWKAGVQNLEAELAAYDTSCEQETVMNQDVEMTIFGVSEEDETGPAVKNNWDTSIPRQPLTPSVKKFDLTAVIDWTH
ncbi:hypothetical protein CPB84DRAFT_1750991 [Gymnopilus junonius]|uniref:Uncharacterized protein n=1 Tax=Gymnopilus junonius TaxID=109634 RepID=A0A9P5NFR8_GYMJU|nr:hypothetical protein CPB84DRAFT_1750991 [Gymnopilus junonius]